MPVSTPEQAAERARKRAAMVADLHRLRGAHAANPGKRTQDRRNAAIYRWHKELGRGYLSAIAREAGISRVQAGRIVKAAAVAEATGEPAKASRTYYQ